MTERVRITDVSPRDGLQNEPGVIPTAEKVRLVELLCATGVDEVEVTSFVSPKWVPQLGDAAEVLDELMTRLFNELPRSWPRLNVLIPNEVGMRSFLEVMDRLRVKFCTHPKAETYYDSPRTNGHFVDKISVFTAASETFNRRNTNASIAESIDRFRSLLALEDGSRQIRGYISCVVACPFEGPIHPSKVLNVARSLASLGVDEIDLGDTIGAAAVDTITHLIELLRDEFNTARLTLHLHDTFGRAADCVKAALDLGVRSFDGSVAGLGGCPYASTPGKRAPGNISTELLVRTVEGAGYKTGVDLGKLEEAARFAKEIVGKARAGA